MLHPLNPNNSILDVKFILKYYKIVESSKNVEDLEMSGGAGIPSSEDEDLANIWTQYQKDMMCVNNDFLKLSGDLEVTQFFGAREFILLIPVERCMILDESRIKVLQSSLASALYNAQW